MLKRDVWIYSLFVLGGCASQPIGPFPDKDIEYTQSLSSLKKSYPEIVRYDQNKTFGYCADVNELVQQFGEPNEIKTEWFQVPLLTIPMGLYFGGPGGAAVVVIGYGMYPKQPKIYTWMRGDYKIVSRTVIDISCRYGTRIHYINWKEINDD